MRIVAIIPALNESKHIAQVVKDTLPHVDYVRVVDGGSEDNTWRIARDAGARTYFHKTKGLGINLQKGLSLTLNLKYKPDIIILLDGDGQHNPAEIPALLTPILENKADVVVGNRTTVRGMPPYRLFGNGILSACVNFRARQQFRDSMTGFWAIRSAAVPKLTEKGWGVYTELLIKVRSNGHRLTSVPVTPIYHRDYNDNSAEKPLRLGFILLWSIIKWRFVCEVIKK